MTELFKQYIMQLFMLLGKCLVQEEVDSLQT